MQQTKNRKRNFTNLHSFSVYVIVQNEGGDEL